MNAPLVDSGLFGDGVALALAVPIGIAFGLTLERAGLGTAPKLAGQFALTDLTVFKVMFSALVTAMLGAFWLARLGFLDLGRVTVPETFVLPQLVGGLLFGIGFSVCGLCPGTSCVAAATGRADGAMVVLGMFAGVLGGGVIFDSWQATYESSARGPWTLPQLLHLSLWRGRWRGHCFRAGRLWGSAVVREEGPLRAHESRTVRPSVRRALGAAALTLGALAALCGEPQLRDEVSAKRPDFDIATVAGEIADEKDHITAVELARWIRDKKPGLRVIDVRSREGLDRGRIPTAETVDIGALLRTTFPAADTIVLYSAEGVHAGQAWVLLRARGFGNVFFLRGGFAAWLDEVRPGPQPATVPTHRHGC
jgi:rhodanese-related sulfurtransferase